MSIFHRVTGAALYFGTLLLVLVADRRGVGTERIRQGAMVHRHEIGRLILLGYTWALIHHMLGGIRHLIWDTSHGFGATERNGWCAPGIGGSIAATIVPVDRRLRRDGGAR